MAIYNNEPHSAINKLVKEDLSKYGQHNACPKSLTVVKDKFWRHYELGAIYGFVIYNEFIDNQEYFRIASLEEDDENWFAPRCGMCVDSAWTNAINITWQRIVEWYNAHIRQGWEKDADVSNPAEYKRELKLPIEPEVIMWDDDIPDNAVLGKKFLYIDENTD